MASKRILILGAKGMLGTILSAKLAKNTSLQVMTHSQTSFADFGGDLFSYTNVEDLLVKSKADFCVNAMALTDVNLSETDKEKAHRLNVAPAQNITKAILQKSLLTKVIQVSTDHMYDQKNATEDDVKIVNNYALTKYVADEVVQLVGAAVLRTNFFGASQSAKKSFSDWIIESLQQGKSLQGFNDVYFAPLHVETLCQEIERVILNFHPGVYNLGSREGLTKFDFMIKLAQHKKLLTSQISAVEYAEAKIPIPRPRDMRMSVAKYEKTFGVKLPTLLEEIHRC